MKQNVLEYLAAAAIKYSDKIAVSDNEKEYSFDDLLSLSRKLGNKLKIIGSNKPVGVIAKPSCDTLVYFFGVLFSGNFFVPIDPDIAHTKYQKIIENSGISIVLGFDETMRISKIGQECKIPDIGDKEPCYMIYTSGSTGNPKGIVKSHKSVISFIEAYQQTFNFNKDTIIGNQTPFFFDASMKDILVMLKTGATLEIIPRALFSFPTKLIEYMNNKRINFISWTPSALAILSKSNIFESIKPFFLKRVFFVGEQFPIDQVTIWRDALPKIEYVNLYGASELAGICSYFIVPDDISNLSRLPIGIPLPNCQLYLKKGNGFVTEINTIGEICIVSDALFTRYYKDSLKTRKSRMEIIGQPAYKSGDLAWYDEKGNLVFSSRKDGQIKHYGYRVELGEIEVSVSALDGVEETSCFYDEKRNNIVLFYSGDAEKHDIAEYAKLHLPRYMFPNHIEKMEFLPKNKNGKIDRVLLKEIYHCEYE